MKARSIRWFPLLILIISLSFIFISLSPQFEDFSFSGEGGNEEVELDNSENEVYSRVVEDKGFHEKQDYIVPSNPLVLMNEQDSLEDTFHWIDTRFEFEKTGGWQHPENMLRQFGKWGIMKGDSFDVSTLFASMVLCLDDFDSEEVRVVVGELPLEEGYENHAFCEVKVDEEWMPVEFHDKDGILSTEIGHYEDSEHLIERDYAFSDKFFWFHD